MRQRSQSLQQPHRKSKKKKHKTYSMNLINLTTMIDNILEATDSKIETRQRPFISGKTGELARNLAAVPKEQAQFYHQIDSIIQIHDLCHQSWANADFELFLVLSLILKTAWFERKNEQEETELVHGITLLKQAKKSLYNKNEPRDRNREELQKKIEPFFTILADIVQQLQTAHDLLLPSYYKTWLEQKLRGRMLAYCPKHPFLSSQNSNTTSLTSEFELSTDLVKNENELKKILRENDRQGIFKISSKTNEETFNAISAGKDVNIMTTMEDLKTMVANFTAKPSTASTVTGGALDTSNARIIRLMSNFVNSTYLFPYLKKLIDSFLSLPPNSQFNQNQQKLSKKNKNKLNLTSQQKDPTPQQMPLTPVAHFKRIMLALAAFSTAIEQDNSPLTKKLEKEQIKQDIIAIMNTLWLEKTYVPIEIPKSPMTTPKPENNNAPVASSSAPVEITRSDSTSSMPSTPGSNPGDIPSRTPSERDLDFGISEAEKIPRTRSSSDAGEPRTGVIVPQSPPTRDRSLTVSTFSPSKKVSFQLLQKKPSKSELELPVSDPRTMDPPIQYTNPFVETVNLIISLEKAYRICIHFFKLLEDTQNITPARVDQIDQGLQSDVANQSKELKKLKYVFLGKGKVKNRIATLEECQKMNNSVRAFVSDKKMTETMNLTLLQLIGNTLKTLQEKFQDIINFTNPHINTESIEKINVPDFLSRLLTFIKEMHTDIVSIHRFDSLTSEFTKHLQTTRLAEQSLPSDFIEQHKPLLSNTYRGVYERHIQSITWRKQGQLTNLCIELQKQFINLPAEESTTQTLEYLRKLMEELKTINEDCEAQDKYDQPKNRFTQVYEGMTNYRKQRTTFFVLPSEPSSKQTRPLPPPPSSSAFIPPSS